MAGTVMVPRQKLNPLVVSILVAGFSGAGVQIASGLIWGGKIIDRIQFLEEKNKDQDLTDEKMNIRLQQLPLLEQRLHSLEDTVNRNTVRIDTLQQSVNNVNPLTTAQLDSVRQNITRIEELQRRTLESIENLYAIIARFRDGTEQIPKRSPPKP